MGMDFIAQFKIQQVSACSDDKVKGLMIWHASTWRFHHPEVKFNSQSGLLISVIPSHHGIPENAFRWYQETVIKDPFRSFEVAKSTVFTYQQAADVEVVTEAKRDSTGMELFKLFKRGTATGNSVSEVFLDLLPAFSTVRQGAFESVSGQGVGTN
ncbi:hypothetical protein ACLOJK_026218 [Asimina triloba]